MKTKLQELKKELKTLATEIRKTRTEYKDRQRNGTYSEWVTALRRLKKLQWEFRHKHIAYCLLRGTLYEDIEKTVGDDNQPNWSIIEGVKNVYGSF